MISFVQDILLNNDADKVGVKPAVAIIALQGPHVLLVRSRKPGRGVELPGGKILPGESVHAAAVRELHEECGLVTDPQYVYFVGGKRSEEWEVYFAQVLAWSGALRAGSDAASAFWGDIYALREGSFPVDYDHVMRVYDRQRTRETR